MPLDVRIIHAHEFVQCTPAGTIDFASSKKALSQIASFAAPLADYEIILDIRKARSQLSVGDLWHLAAYLGELGTTFRRKTAVLAPLEEFDHAEFFSLCAGNIGFPVRAFTSFEDAIQWLGSDEPSP
jgi:hypothetical protein